MTNNCKIIALKAALVLTLAFCATGAQGQKFAVKTNTLYWATTTPNLGFEFALGKQTTLDISGSYNPWMFSGEEENKKLQHWMIQPELRLWNCKAFNRGFWGFHVHGGKYNMGGVELPLGIFSKLKDYRYEGWLVGAGVGYGHQWYLGPHWNLEAEFGFGYAYMKYKRFDCVRCGDLRDKGSHHYFGPTRVRLSLVYHFKYKTR